MSEQRNNFTAHHIRLYVLKCKPTGCVALNSVSVLKVRKKNKNTATTTKYFYNWLLVGHEHNFSLLFFSLAYESWANVLILNVLCMVWTNEWIGLTYAVICGAANTWRPYSHTMSNNNWNANSWNDFVQQIVGFAWKCNKIEAKRRPKYLKNEWLSAWRISHRCMCATDKCTAFDMSKWRENQLETCFGRELDLCRVLIS